MTNRLDWLDAAVNLSSKPVRVCPTSRRAADEEHHQNTGQSEQRDLKCRVVANLVRTGLQTINNSTYSFADKPRRRALHQDHSPRLRLGVIDDNVVLDVGCYTAGNLLYLIRCVGAGRNSFPCGPVARVPGLLLPDWDSGNEPPIEFMEMSSCSVWQGRNGNAQPGFEAMADPPAEVFAARRETRHRTLAKSSFGTRDALTTEP